MERKKYVILSTPLLLEEGVFRARNITLDKAREWVRTHNPQNFCGHQTVKVLGLEPAQTREACNGYDEALCLKPVGRLEFGREYTVEEILEIGVTPFLISREG